MRKLNLLIGICSSEHRIALKVIPLKLFYYQTVLKLDVVNIHDMNIIKMQ